jgi:hypothetical protein
LDTSPRILDVGHPLGDALSKVRPVGLHLAISKVTLELTHDDPVLMVGDEVEVTVTARVVSATVSEKYSKAANEFIGPLTYSANAIVRDGAVTGHRTRTEIEAEFSERVRQQL